MAVGVGDEAPGFTLPAVENVGRPDEQRRDISLGDYAGRPVVVVFYPGDDTPVCTRQLNAYTAGVEQFAAVDAQVLAISPQSVDRHQQFSCRQGGFAFPLLADEDKAVGAAYGVLGPLGFYRRSVFVVDAAGRIAWAHRAVAGLTFRPVEEIVAAVRAAA